MNSLQPRVVLAALIVLLAAAVCAAEGPFDGHWQGAIQVPGQPLEIDVDLSTAADGTLSGDISIPIQSLADFALSEVVAEDGTIRIQDGRRAR